MLAAAAGCSRNLEKTNQRSNTVSSQPAHPASHPAHTNRLAGEKSPYLQQHKHNPVDWFPWGSEAFDKARKENKPIFLSIGYSTCHWCHVMERESFEDETVARFLNDHFVSIKVDREERPDVDKIYMTAVQAISGQGGWPLNIFLTTDLRPFYGGTYYPPENKYGRPSFLQVLQHISELWNKRGKDVAESALDLTQRLKEFVDQAPGNPGNTSALNRSVLQNAATQFKAEYDSKNGGFGGAPKFPRPSQPIFLLRYGVKFNDQEAINMVLHTCDKMAAGGMYDQLGGGFARYSTDAGWLVPHFEKMLYDNAQLIHLYLDAYLISGQEKFAGIARDIIRYVLRDMTHPSGGFYSAEDADSEGKEGKFYCWSRRELLELLSASEFELVTRYYGVTEKGNFVDHSDPEPLLNQNILSVVDPKLQPGEENVLNSARNKMFSARSKRVRPHLDDKVLASWNGLMLGAIARAYGTLGDAEFLAAAEKNHAFISKTLWDPQSTTLFHRWRQGERDSVQLLTAYACYLEGVLHLYEVTLDPEQLQFAINLATSMIQKFEDKIAGGFFQSAGSDDLILKIKDDYDGAEQSGNSVAVSALLRLAAITERKEFKESAERTLQFFSARMEKIPQAVPNFILGLDYLLEEPRRAVLVKGSNPEENRRLIHSIHSVFQPNKVVLSTTGPVEPFALTLPKSPAPRAYICTGTACMPPTADLKQIQQLMKPSTR